MRKKLLAIAFTAIVTVSAAIPMIGITGTASASCAGGANALKGTVLPVGPGNRGLGDTAKAAATDGTGHGVSDDVHALQDDLC